MFLLKALILLVVYVKHSNMSLILNAINQFQGYNLIIHYNNGSLSDVNDILQLSAKKFCTYLINHDTNNKHFLINGYNFLHVILINSFNLQSYTLIRYKMDVRDRVLIIINTDIKESDLLEICEWNGPHGAGGVFIFERFYKSVSSCCYYCGKKKISLSKIELVNKNIPKLKLFVNNFTNFHGYLFKIGFSHFIPFFYCSEKRGNQCIIRGTEFDLLKTLSDKMNFRYKLVEYSGYYNSGAWEAMLEEVRDKKIDWAVSGITQNLKRSENLDFTKYIAYQGYMAIFAVQDDQWLVTIQFLYSVFISNWTTVLIIGISGIGITLVTKWSLNLLNNHSKSVMEYAFMPLVYLVEQQSSKLQNRKTWKPQVKILFVLWWFVCCCLTTYYKTQQAYVLMSAATNPANMDEMVDRRFKFTIHHEDWPLLNFNCGNSSLKVCKNMLKSIDVVSDICGSIMGVLKQKIGFIEEESPLQFLALGKCGLNINQKYKLRLVPVYPIPREWHAWPMQESAPFTNAFSRMFSRLEANGLLQYWYTKKLHIFHGIPRSNQVGYLRSETNPLNLYHFLFPFMILVIGYVISSIVCLVEMYRARYKYKSTAKLIRSCIK